jgi:nucleoside 2-deoxyribosyltransferase
MKTSLIVYLAGPMAGITVKECRAWRLAATPVLEDAGFTILDPTRELIGYPDDFVLTQQAESKRVVFARDKFDATRADILLVNLLGATDKSLGTLMEVAWAYLSGKFIVVVMEPEGNPHDHTFTREAASIVPPTIEEGVDYIVVTFGQG